MFLSQMKPEEELQTEEPNHSVKPNRSVMMKGVKRMRMMHRGKEVERRRPDPVTVKRMRRRTVRV